MGLHSVGCQFNFGSANTELYKSTSGEPFHPPAAQGLTRLQSVETGSFAFCAPLSFSTFTSYQAALALAAEDTVLRVLLESRIEDEQADMEELERMLADPGQGGTGEL